MSSLELRFCPRMPPPHSEIIICLQFQDFFFKIIIQMNNVGNVESKIKYRIGRISGDRISGSIEKPDVRYRLDIAIAGIQQAGYVG